jgi:GT2 family glycosyltransferase
MQDDVTVVIINFETPDLTERAVRSLRAAYPDIRLLLIDNGSGDESVALLKELHALHAGRTELLFNLQNIHHGPAMDEALRSIASPLVLFLDSDCEVRKRGFVEGMTELMLSGENIYAVGKRIFMNDRGFDIGERRGAHPYIRPICMLIRKQHYFDLPPFERHGAPCLANFIVAEQAGLGLLHFPVEDFIFHEGRGTAGRHGYRLGVRGKLNHLLNKLRL